jgi:hypothetical protein
MRAQLDAVPREVAVEIPAVMAYNRMMVNDPYWSIRPPAQCRRK